VNSLFEDHLVIVRGGGDIGSGVVWRLRRVGFPVVVLELARPLTVRRTVAFSSAVTSGTIEIDGIRGVRVASPEEAIDAARLHGVVPVLVTEEVPVFPLPITVLIDARLAKAPLDTSIDQAPLVIGLGPGFTAGTVCDAVVETMRGHRLGTVIWEGAAFPDTGVPGELGGASADRLLRATVDGTLTWDVGFGEAVEAGQHLGTIDDAPVVSGVAGVVRGMLAPGDVTAGLKIGDVDPRSDADAVRHISDKALAVGGGALEAILVWLNRRGR
jgi:xanthine dehydrogenase accessory factor